MSAGGLRWILGGMSREVGRFQVLSQKIHEAAYASPDGGFSSNLLLAAQQPLIQSNLMPFPNALPPWDANQLETDQIGLVVARLSDISLHHHAWLSTAEREHMQGMQNGDVARRFLATRILLRSVLSQALGCDPQSLDFVIADGGKPYLSLPDSSLKFNLSHSGDYALVGVSSNLEVGVDIEMIRSQPKALQLAMRVLPESDVERLKQIPANQAEAAFFELWTAYEARQKAVGQGVFGRATDGVAWRNQMLQFERDSGRFMHADDTTNQANSSGYIRLAAAVAWAGASQPRLGWSMYRTLR